MLLIAPWRSASTLRHEAREIYFILSNSNTLIVFSLISAAANDGVWRLLEGGVYYRVWCLVEGGAYYRGVALSKYDDHKWKTQTLNNKRIVLKSLKYHLVLPSNPINVEENLKNIKHINKYTFFFLKESPQSVLQLFFAMFIVNEVLLSYCCRCYSSLAQSNPFIKQRHPSPCSYYLNMFATMQGFCIIIH